MGYQTAADIPNYWAYAHNFVLQDQMFEPNASWSLPAHLFMVSGWSATMLATRRSDDLRAATSVDPDKEHARENVPDYAWTDLTYLLHKHHI